MQIKLLKNDKNNMLINEKQRYFIRFIRFPDIRLPNNLRID